MAVECYEDGTPSSDETELIMVGKYALLKHYMKALSWIMKPCSSTAVRLRAASKSSLGISRSFALGQIGCVPLTISFAAHMNTATVLDPLEVLGGVGGDISEHNDSPELLEELWDAFKAQEFTDCKVAIYPPQCTEPSFVKCHKLILCRIPHFRQQLKDPEFLAANTDEEGDIVLEIKDTEIALFLHALGFAYTGRVETLESDFVHLDGDTEEPALRYTWPHDDCGELQRPPTKDEILLPAKIAALALKIGLFSLAHRAREIYKCNCWCSSAKQHPFGGITVLNGPHCPLDVLYFDEDLLCDYVELMYPRYQATLNDPITVRCACGEAKRDLRDLAFTYFRSNDSCPGKYQKAFDRVPALYDDLVDYYLGLTFRDDEGRESQARIRDLPRSEKLKAVIAGFNKL
ncbi:hypothetical protein ABW21_db0201186 [Orbilia brochopaga]|nr:hypothetical protein ABW21_db0201186 [Drechslerella brochopaga]